MGVGIHVPGVTLLQRKECEREIQRQRKAMEGEIQRNERERGRRWRERDTEEGESERAIPHKANWLD